MPERDSGEGSRARTGPPAAHRPAEAERTGAAAGPATDVRTVQRLQGRAGNAAVARLVAQRKAAARPPGVSAASGAPIAPAAPAVQRLAGGSTTLPAAPTGAGPEQDPRFRSASADVRTKAAALGRHASPTAEAQAARDAAVAPADDREAQGKAAQVGKMASARPGVFDRAGFIAAVNAAVAAQSPKNLKEAEGFAASGRADGIKNQVMGQVTSGKKTSAQEVATRAAETPDPSRAVEKQATPLPDRPAPAAPAGPDPAAASVAAAPPEQTDLRGTPQQTDAAMAAAGITPEQLAASNEPQFQQTLHAKQAADQHAATAPAAFRASEAERLGAEKAGVAALGRSGMQGLATAKATSGHHLTTGQTAAKAKEEAARAAVTTELKTTYDTTKGEVDGILAELDQRVDSTFTAGEAEAKTAFTTDQQTRMAAYKDQRYAGVSGAAQWVVDEFKGLPPEANEIFQLSRRVYETKMQELVGRIADLVGTQLARATTRIATGRDQVAAIVARQPKELQKFAADAAKDFGGRFDELDSAVADKSKSLVDDLAQRYVAARGVLDEEIKALQAENQGLLDAAMGALQETVETVKKLADMIAGVAARAAGAIDKIIARPIEFLGNLVTAVKAGVLGFASRAGEHIKQGLKDWVFGQLSAGGIEIPETFDAKGIIQLVLSILGLTWGSIRARVVKQIPEPTMKALEGTFGMVRTLVTEGVGGLWRWIVQKVSDIKDTVIGAIKDFILEKIVTAGITWIVSLLNPASAFIRACKAIYDVIMFFVDRAAQIKSFIDSVLDSIEGIAAGGGGGVPALIEASLAKAIPVVLDFLADLLGLGGISKKIEEILHRIQAPVMKVVDWVVGKIVAAGKKLLGKVKSKVQGGDDTPEGKQKRLDKGMAAATAAANRFGGKRVPRQALDAVLGIVRLKYGLTRLEAVEAGDNWSVHGVVNPEATEKVNVKVPKGTAEAAERMIVAEGSKATSEQELESVVSAAGKSESLDSAVVKPAPQGAVVVLVDSKGRRLVTVRKRLLEPAGDPGVRLQGKSGFTVRSHVAIEFDREVNLGSIFREKPANEKEQERLVKRLGGQPFLFPGMEQRSDQGGRHSDSLRGEIVPISGKPTPASMVFLSTWNLGGHIRDNHSSHAEAQVSNWLDKTMKISPHLYLAISSIHLSVSGKFEPCRQCAVDLDRNLENFEKRSSKPVRSTIDISGVKKVFSAEEKGNIQGWSRGSAGAADRAAVYSRWGKVVAGKWAFLFAGH